MTADSIDGNNINDLERLRNFFRSLENSQTYNRNLKTVEPVFASKEKCVFEMDVAEESTNSYGTLHGAATMCLLDVLTAWSVLLSVDEKDVVSVDMSCSYILPVVRGDRVEVIVSVLRVGRTTAFTEAEFRRKSDGRVVAKGKQTLAIIEKKRK